jgi:sugar lactone lactonase YvrE
MGRTNGIEVSADGKWLYVSEAFNKDNNPVSNMIWRFPVKPDGALDVNKKELVVDFAAADGSGKYDVDGMRLDVTGKLYVTRNGAGEVAVVDPAVTNKILYKIKLPFSAPTNLEFGGLDGRTLFVVGRCGVNTPWGKGDGCVEAIPASAAGLYWTGLQQGLPRVAV